MQSSTPSLPEHFNVAAYFVDRNLEEGRGDSVAVFYRDRQLTYRQVAEQVSRASNAFRNAGIRKSDRVLLLLLDSPAFVSAFWGAIRLGAVPIPSNTLLQSEDYEFKLRDSQARCLVVQDRLLEKVAGILANRENWPELAVIYGVGDEGRPDAAGGALNFDLELAKNSPQAPPAPTCRNDSAFWLYTSGSTGRPKAAIHRHSDMVFCFELYARQVLGITAADRTFSTSKLFFAYGLGNALYFPFGAGASTVLLDGRPTVEKIFEMLSRHRPTIFYAVPSVYAALLQAPETPQYNLSSVRCAVSAGEALPGPLWERFRARFGISILDGIGSTEMLHMFISNRPDDTLPGSSGKLVPGYEARVVDEQGKQVPPGQIGELLVRGESAASAYWNRPELSQSTFRGGWTATGDKYTRDERGYFWYCGRTDDMLKVSGMWVSPLEIESAILSHPGVAECAVVGFTDREGLTKPKAFVVAKYPAREGELEAEIGAFLRARLPGYKVPRWFVRVDSLPRTATGKVQRFKLRRA